MPISGAFMVFYSFIALINPIFQVIALIAHNYAVSLLTALSANSSLRQLGSGCWPYRLVAIK
jgi:hypothetical protein